MASNKWCRKWDHGHSSNESLTSISVGCRECVWAEKLACLFIGAECGLFCAGQQHCLVLSLKHLTSERERYGQSHEEAAKQAHREKRSLYANAWVSYEYLCTLKYLWIYMHLCVLHIWMLNAFVCKLFVQYVYAHTYVLFIISVFALCIFHFFIVILTVCCATTNL